MTMDKYEGLKLENQLCFPLYACAKEVVRSYQPLLDELELTYTQYIAMMVLWQCEKINVKHLGEMLLLDSGTLTPLLKKLEAKGYVSRSRSEEDERVLNVALTDKGRALKDRAASIPPRIACCLGLSEDEAKTMYALLYKAIGNMRAGQKRNTYRPKNSLRRSPYTFFSIRKRRPYRPSFSYNKKN